MNRNWIFILLVGSLAQRGASNEVDNESEWFVKEADINDTVEVQSSLSLPWFRTKSSSILLHPPEDPEDSDLEKVLRNERSKLSARMQARDFKKALKQADILLSIMKPVTETTKNKRYNVFVYYLMRDRITCLRQLDRYLDALIETQNLIKYATDKLRDSDVDYSKKLLTTVSAELAEKVNSLLLEYHSLNKSPTTQPSQLKKIHENMIKLLPGEGMSLLDKNLQDIFTVMRRRVDNAGKNASGKLNVW